MIRKSAVAGSFYPAGQNEIKKTVLKFINDAPGKKYADLKGIIVPHARYIYSGPTAGFAYKQLTDLPDKKWNVFILGPAHYGYTTASVGDFDEFETPLGKIPVNKTICGELLKNVDMEFLPQVHGPEHSLEVQLPFLQMTLKNFEIIPILLGEINPDRISEILNPYFNTGNSLFVISSDLSHYTPYKEAAATDKNSISKIISLATVQENEIDACGSMGIEVAMRLAKNNSCKIELLDYRNSGDTAGQKDSVVGYASLAIYKY
jgi:hypothetical protein